MDAHILIARAFAIVTGLLCAYLAACGISALIEWIEENLRR